MRRPRSDVVLRRFMAGETILHIAATTLCERTWGSCAPLPGIVPHWHLRRAALDARAVESALRRGWLRMEARAERKGRRK